jgi:transketolase
MRDAFLDELYNIACRDRRVILLSDDLGAPSLDKFRRDLHHQYFNVGIAEQGMVSLAAGLALGGKVVFAYGIAPFLTLRCLEQIKIGMCSMNLPVTILGVGAGYAYDNAGLTHHAVEDISIMNILSGMTILSPSDNVMVTAFAQIAYTSPGPKYIRFDREKFPLIYDENKSDFSAGLAVLREGRDITIVATGIMVHQALKVADELSKHAVDAGVIDLYRIKPLNEALLMEAVAKTRRVVTMEENFLSGGIGSIIASLLADRGETVRLRRFGVPDKYLSQGGGREELHRLSGLDVASVTENTLRWLGK